MIPPKPASLPLWPFVHGDKGGYGKSACVKLTEPSIDGPWRHKPCGVVHPKQPKSRREHLRKRLS